jgi:putative FmdB family regulatory protein
LRACGHQQEFLQKVSDAPLTVCTKCGAQSFSKMVTRAGFQLKGSGWYATDFKNSGRSPRRRSGRDRSPAALVCDAAKTRRRIGRREEGCASSRRRAVRRGTAAPSAAMHTLRRYFVAGLLVWIPLGITLWVLKLTGRRMDQSLLLLPEPSAASALRLPRAGWLILTWRSCSTTGARREFLRAARCSTRPRPLGAHPHRALDLPRREADQRHALLARGQGFRRAVLCAISARARGRWRW